MSTIKLNGSSGISGYEADNTTLIIEQSVSSLGGINPQAFPSSQTLTLQNGVKVDGTVTPPVLRFRGDSKYIFQGNRQIIISMAAFYDIYKADSYLATDDGAGTSSYTTVGQNDWWSVAPSIQIIGGGTSLFSSKTTMTFITSNTSYQPVVNSPNTALNITIKSPAGQTLVYISSPTIYTTSNGALGFDVPTTLNDHLVAATSGGVIPGYQLIVDLPI